MLYVSMHFSSGTRVRVIEKPVPEVNDALASRHSDWPPPTEHRMTDVRLRTPRLRSCGAPQQMPALVWEDAFCCARNSQGDFPALPHAWRSGGQSEVRGRTLTISDVDIIKKAHACFPTREKAWPRAPPRAQALRSPGAGRK